MKPRKNFTTHVPWTSKNWLAFNNNSGKIIEYIFDIFASRDLPFVL